LTDRWHRKVRGNGRGFSDAIASVQDEQQENAELTDVYLYKFLAHPYFYGARASLPMVATFAERQCDEREMPAQLSRPPAPPTCFDVVM